MRSPAISLLRTLPLPGGTKVHLAGELSRRTQLRGPLQVKARMHEGFRMALNLAAPTERGMYYSGIYEPWLTHAFRRILQPGNTVIDGGANIGFFSLLAAKCVGTAGAVYSFEPVPATFERLSENIKLNKYANITANRVALMSQAGEISIEVPVEANTNLSLDRLASVLHRSDGHVVTTQACTLDEYAARVDMRPIKLAKLDIEGSEVSALLGMRALLSARQISYLICEVNVPLLEQQGLPPSALRDTLATYGYEAYYFERLGGRRRPVRVEFIPVSKLPQPDIFGDYLFVAPGTEVPRM